MVKGPAVVQAGLIAPSIAAEQGPQAGGRIAGISSLGCLNQQAPIQLFSLNQLASTMGGLRLFQWGCLGCIRWLAGCVMEFLPRGQVAGARTCLHPEWFRQF